MKRKKVIEEYFDFTKKSRLAIFSLIFLLIISTFLPRLFLLTSNQKSSITDTAWIASVKQLEIKDTGNNQESLDQDNPYYYQFDRRKDHSQKAFTGELFYFDPNTASPEDWKKLGIKDKTSKTIQNYLARGGHFKKPEDLKKIYGLHDDEYNRLLPFIRIKEEVKHPEAADYRESREFGQKRVYAIIDINTADTTSFISLPGIGSKLAARILNFREKLGGFYSVDQVKETYGLPDSTFQKIKPYLEVNGDALRKININTATADELNAHPYIKYNIANPIIAYRKQHGPFSKIEDIKKVMVVTDELYEKINHYLSVQ